MPAIVAAAKVLKFFVSLPLFKMIDLMHFISVKET